MTNLPILIHPDPRLKKMCEPIADIDDDLRKLASDTLQTPYDAPGTRPAAPQVGVTKRMLVMDRVKTDEAPPEPMVLINPEILDAADDLNEYEEGCLSIPDQFANVTRPAEVKVGYIDQNGDPQEREFDGLWATCVQHEIDHLNGKLFIDYLGAVRRQMITQKMKKLKRERTR